MKQFLRLFAVSLVPLLSLSGPALPRQYDVYGTGGFARDVYSDESVYPADYPFYSATSRDFNSSYNENVPTHLEWAYDAYRGDFYAAPDPLPERTSKWGYPSRSPVDRADGYGWEGASQQEVRGRWGYTHPTDSSPRGGYAPAPVPAYGSRGDDPPGFRDWRGLGGRPVYRFRPLSQQERGRLNAGAGWRPWVPRPAHGQPRYTDPLPSEEAYGYQPDSWLRSYDGVGR